MFTFDADLSNNTFDDAIRIINPYEFIFSKVPGSKFSVSKLKPNTNLFYDLYEIFNNLNLFENCKNDHIKSLHVSPNYNDSVECFEMFREGFEDDIINFNSIDIDNELSENNIEYIFYETTASNEREYFISLVKIMITILRSQKYQGNIIIKINKGIHKNLPLPIKTNGSEIFETGRPLLKIRANPLTMVIVPSVSINGALLLLVIRNPLKTPTIKPAKSPARTGIISG
jgi:hypothetical protein